MGWDGSGYVQGGPAEGRSTEVRAGTVGCGSAGRRQPIIHGPWVGAFPKGSLLSIRIRGDQGRECTKNGVLEVFDAGLGKTGAQVEAESIVQRGRDDKFSQQEALPGVGLGTPCLADSSAGSP